MWINITLVIQFIFNLNFFDLQSSEKIKMRPKNWRFGIAGNRENAGSKLSNSFATKSKNKWPWKWILLNFFKKYVEKGENAGKEHFLLFHYVSNIS